MNTNRDRFLMLVQTKALEVEVTQPEGKAAECLALAMCTSFTNHISRDRVLCPLYLNRLASAFVNWAYDRRSTDDFDVEGLDLSIHGYEGKAT